MTPYDFMLSESQERMLICAKKGCEQAIIDIFEKWELDVAVIGEVTNTEIWSYSGTVKNVQKFQFNQYLNKHQF